MANPPFNMKGWWDRKLEGDPHWEHGEPARSNANLGCPRHMLYHLPSDDSMAVLLVNRLMSRNLDVERETLFMKDLVECMVALPGQRYTNTQIPACIWFLTKTKEKRGRGANAFRDRSGEGRYVGAEEVEDDGISFTDKMATLTSELANQFAESEPRAPTQCESQMDDRDRHPFSSCRPFGASRSCWNIHPRVCTRGYNMPSLRDKCRKDGELDPRVGR